MLLLGAMWEHGLQSVGHHPDTSFQRHLSQGKQGSWMDMSADIHVNLILHSLGENERRHRGLQGSMELLCCCCSGLSTKRAKEKQGKQRQESQERRAGGTALFFTPAILCVSFFTHFTGLGTRMWHMGNVCITMPPSDLSSLWSLQWGGTQTALEKPASTSYGEASIPNSESIQMGDLSPFDEVSFSYQLIKYLVIKLVNILTSWVQLVFCTDFNIDIQLLLSRVEYSHLHTATSVHTLLQRCSFIPTCCKTD